MSTHESLSTTHAPSTFADRAASAVLLVRQAYAALALAPRKQTASQRRHGLKFRKGVEPSIRTVAHLSDQYGIVVPGKPTSEMRASLARAESLRTVRTALAGALAAVDAALFEEQGDAYGTALTLYGMLKKVGHRHLEIRAVLAPVAAFFSYRHPKRAEESEKDAAQRTGSEGASPAL